MSRRLGAPLLFAALFALLGCSSPDETGPTPDPTPDPKPDPVETNTWLSIELPGTVCGNGSQYRFFVNYSGTSDNLLVMFEPGGACWDFDSCSGKAGVEGAANIDGIDENHMAAWQLAFPFLRRQDETNPLRDWNLVYVPYCTGDVHIGNDVVTYKDPLGQEPDLEFHHAGYTNTLAVTDWLKEKFPAIPRLVVSGCSAGGVGSLANYYFVRNTLSPEHAYLLNDSGPMFPGSVNSKPLYDQIRASWNIDAVFADLPFSVDTSDLGSVNLLVADQFPDDRLGVTFFLRDHVFSSYSYRRFYPGLTDEERLALWKEDADLLQSAYDGKNNLAYFLPYWRQRADSHCGTALDYVGTEIQESGVDLGDFIDTLLDDTKPLESYRESVQPGEDVP